MSTELIEGYVWLSSYDDRNNRNQEHSTDYKRVFDAIKDGRVHGLQDGKSKRWVVNKSQADAFLNERAECVRASSKAKPKSSVESAQIEMVISSLHSIDTTLDEIYRVLERLTQAVESIATQPKVSPAITTETVYGNGFHN